VKSFSQCFVQYHAKLINPQWAVSAIAQDGSLVLSCWSLYFSRPNGNTLRYTDKLSRWSGNELGNNLLRSHLEAARTDDLTIRLVIATPLDRRVVDEGKDASKAGNKFHTKPDVEGRLAAFDGDEFVIDFCRKQI